MKKLMIILTILLSGCSEKTQTPIKSTEVEVTAKFKFKFGQTVKAKDSGSLFDKCIGKITDGYHTKTGNMYNVLLTKCPAGRVEKQVRGGEEFFEAVK
jgi:hypothetical protein